MLRSLVKSSTSLLQPVITAQCSPSKCCIIPVATRLLAPSTARASFQEPISTSSASRSNIYCRRIACHAADAAGPATAASAPEAAPELALPPQAPSKPVLKHYKVRPITKDDVEFAFARSSGAGGQNVNKVNTKVDMRLDLAKATWIPQEVRDEIAKAEKNRISKEGWLVVSSQKNRLQAQNMEDALDKLQAMINAAVAALAPPDTSPETVERVKKNIKAGQERRLQDKKKGSDKKKERSRRDWD